MHLPGRSMHCKRGAADMLTLYFYGEAVDTST